MKGACCRDEKLRYWQVSAETRGQSLKPTGQNPGEDKLLSFGPECDVIESVLFFVYASSQLLQLKIEERSETAAYTASYIPSLLTQLQLQIRI